MHSMHKSWSRSRARPPRAIKRLAGTRLRSCYDEGPELATCIRYVRGDDSHYFKPGEEYQQQLHATPHTHSWLAPVPGLVGVNLMIEIEID